MSLCSVFINYMLYPHHVRWYWCFFHRFPLSIKDVNEKSSLTYLILYREKPWKNVIDNLPELNTNDTKNTHRCFFFLAFEISFKQNYVAVYAMEGHLHLRLQCCVSRLPLCCNVMVIVKRKVTNLKRIRLQQSLEKVFVFMMERFGDPKPL